MVVIYDSGFCGEFPMRRKKFIFLFAFFIILMTAGLALGEYTRVLEQAITICLSCIGIG